MSKAEEGIISAAPKEHKNSPSRYHLRLPLDDHGHSIYGCGQVFDLQLTAVGLALIGEQLALWRRDNHNGKIDQEMMRLLFCCHPLLSRNRGGTTKVEFGTPDFRRDLRFVVSHLPKASKLTKQMLQYLSMILRRKGLVFCSIEKILQFVGVPSALSSALLPHISPLCCEPKENISPYLQLIQTKAPGDLIKVSLYGNFRGPYAQERPAVQDSVESSGTRSAVSTSSEPPLKRKKKSVASTSTP